MTPDNLINSEDILKGKSDYYNNWKIRKTLTSREICMISRLLCICLEVDKALQVQCKRIFRSPEEEQLCRQILDKMLLTPRMSSSHKSDKVTHPDYRDKSFHGKSILHFDVDMFLSELKFLELFGSQEEFKEKFRNMSQEKWDEAIKDVIDAKNDEIMEKFSVENGMHAKRE